MRYAGNARAALLITALALSGCAIAPSAPISAGAESAWQSRQAALAAIPAWTLAGRIAVNNDTASDGAPDAANNNVGSAINVSATLNWAQQPNDYRIEVVPPFGQGAINLEGNDAGVMIRLPGGRRLSAADPEALLYQQTNLRLPISSLRYWVMGRPDPAFAAHKALDDSGRALWLEQSGWRVEFLRYNQINGLDMPDKLTVTRPPLRLRLVIDRWEL